MELIAKENPKSDISAGGRNLKSKRGFTLAEMLVVISIIVFLSAILILYSHTGENQVVLFREQSRLILALNRAKSLSIQLFNTPQAPCGFGVHFSPANNNFIIFRDLAADCQTSDNIYTGSGEIFETYQLAPQIRFGETTLNDIIFIPPDPKTLLDNNPAKNDAIITLRTLSADNSLRVRVNSAGQITTD